METSYFGAMRQLKGKRLVCIAIGVPQWYRGESEKRVSPRRDMLDLPEAEYRKEFEKILAQVDANAFWQEYQDAVLLCYERPGEFCHRRLVAEWIERETGNKVEEFGGYVRPQESVEKADEAAPQHEQLSLFDIAGVA